MRYLHLLVVIFTLCLEAKIPPSQNHFDIYAPAGESHICLTTIPKLLRSSYQHFPSIRASKQMLLGAKAGVKSAKWNYFPTTSVDFSQRSGRSGTIIRLDQPLWTGGKLDAATDLATYKEDEAEATIGESAYLLTDKFLTILQNFIRADEEIKGFQSGKTQLLGFSRMLDRRITAGVSSESDRELLNARIAQIDSDILTAKAKFDMAKAQLKLLTGKPLRCGIKLKDHTTQHPNITLEEIEEKISKHHPALQKLQARIAMAEAEKKKKDAQILPNVSLRAEHQKDSIYNNDIENYNLVYINVSYTPGAGLSALSDMESAQYKVLQAQDERNAKQQELLGTAIADYSDYRSAKSRVESIAQTILSTQKVLDSYTRLFITGKRQWLDLVNISREVTQNRVTLAALKAILITSQYRLALQMGEINFEDMKLR